MNLRITGGQTYLFAAQSHSSWFTSDKWKILRVCKTERAPGCTRAPVLCVPLQEIFQMKQKERERETDRQTDRQTDRDGSTSSKNWKPRFSSMSQKSKVVFDFFPIIACGRRVGRWALTFDGSYDAKVYRFFSLPGS